MIRCLNLKDENLPYQGLTATRQKCRMESEVCIVLHRCCCTIGIGRDSRLAFKQQSSQLVMMTKEIV